MLESGSGGRGVDTGRRNLDGDRVIAGLDAHRDGRAVPAALSESHAIEHQAIEGCFGRRARSSLSGGLDSHRNLAVVGDLAYGARQPRLSERDREAREMRPGQLRLLVLVLCPTAGAVVTAAAIAYGSERPRGADRTGTRRRPPASPPSRAPQATLLHRRKPRRERSALPPAVKSRAVP